MTGTDYYPEKPVISPINRFQRIVGGCAGTQYGCNEDGSLRTKEEYEKYRKLTSIIKAVPIQVRILPVKLPDVIVVPKILLPILQPTVKDDTFEEILEAETEGIKTGIGKGIITGVIVGIILMMVMKK